MPGENCPQEGQELPADLVLLVAPGGGAICSGLPKSPFHICKMEDMDTR